MSGADSPNKKPALCRYFATSGTCFYGDDCQFLHESIGGSQRKVFHNPPVPNSVVDNEVAAGGDANNGDQYFTATFSGSNGIPEFTPSFLVKDKNSSTSSPESRMDETSGIEEIRSLSLTSQPSSTLQSSLKNPISDIPEFIPKTSVSSSGVGLTHSASSPSFNSHLGTHQGGLGTPLSHGNPFSAGASPMGSPGLSPTGSPMFQRRTAQNAASTPNSSNNAATLHENVGGTTYFYNPGMEQSSNSGQGGPGQSGIVMPNFTVYPGLLPHVAHMKPKSNMPSFFMPDEIKLEILNRHAVTMAQIDPELIPDIPQEVDNYHNFVPLEPMPQQPSSKMFGLPSTTYKATNTKDGLAYCLRRVHGYRLVNHKCMTLIDVWKKVQHSNIVTLREVFTTKAFGDHSMVFVYDYHPGSETLWSRHFSRPPPQVNGYSNPFNMNGGPRPFSAGKGGNARQNTVLLPESLIWSYIVQLSSSLRTIHAHGLACRFVDPSKILLTDKSRIRLNCVGILNVLDFDPTQTDAYAMMPQYQQEDLQSLGHVIIALACNNIYGAQRENTHASLELVARNYSTDLKNLIVYLIGPNRGKSVNEIMPMIGARFYTQLDAAQLRNDVLENEVSREVENGRLFRLMCKLGTINDRPEYQMDPAWSETGDRYMLKLFRDYLFHQVDANGAPWIDMAHITQCLNKLDAGSPEKVCLTSRDEQSVLVVTYIELKRCVQSAFRDLIETPGDNAFV